MVPPAPQRHDNLFRLVFSDPEEAAAFLRARLPDSLQRRFDWSTLHQIPGSFVDEDRHGAVTDLLFEAQLAAGAEGKPPWLYLLFEHQSGSDRWMAWRLLQLAMMHAFDQAAAEARERFTPLLAELRREPSSGGVDYFNVFFGYIQETGPAGTQQALDEVMRRRAPELRGDLMTNGGTCNTLSFGRGNEAATGFGGVASVQKVGRTFATAAVG